MFNAKTTFISPNLFTNKEKLIKSFAIESSKGRTPWITKWNPIDFVVPRVHLGSNFCCGCLYLHFYWQFSKFWSVIALRLLLLFELWFSWFNCTRTWAEEPLSVRVKSVISWFECSSTWAQEPVSVKSVSVRVWLVQLASILTRASSCSVHNKVLLIVPGLQGQ